MSSSPDCEIISSRIFDDSQELVFRAWTEPEHLAKWWGPKGFTNTFYEYNLVPGGRWLFTMHGPNGGNYENECAFIEIKPNSFLSWDHISPPKFVINVHFEEEADKTRIIFKMIFQTKEECEKIKKIAMGANKENFDRLEAVLLQMKK